MKNIKIYLLIFLIFILLFTIVNFTFVHNENNISNEKKVELEKASDLDEDDYENSITITKNKITKNNMKTLNKMEADVNSYFVSLLGIGYRDIAENTMDYEENVKKYKTDGLIIIGNKELSTSEYISDVSEWLIKNEFEAECSFKRTNDIIEQDTSKKYIYGQIKILIYNCTDISELQKFIPEITLNKPYTIDLKVGLVKNYVTGIWQVSNVTTEQIYT